MISAAPSLKAAEGISGQEIAAHLHAQGWISQPSKVDGVTIFSKKVMGAETPISLILPTRPGFSDEQRRVADALRTLAAIERASVTQIASDVRRESAARFSRRADREKGLKKEAPKAQLTVYVIDEDAAMREEVGTLARSIGLQVELFGSATDFLNQKKKPTDTAECVVLDVSLPGMSGLDLQAELGKAGIRTPIIFLTAHGDIPMSVRAMKAGAVDFLTKPFRDQELLNAIQVALGRRSENREIHEVNAHFHALTPREREVMRLVAAGRLNKQIGAELELSEFAVKMHRGKIMKKMGAKSLTELAQMAAVLGIRPTKS